MPFIESVLVSALLMVIVFFAISCLYGCVRLFSYFLVTIEGGLTNGSQ